MTLDSVNTVFDESRSGSFTEGVFSEPSTATGVSSFATEGGAAVSISHSSSLWTGKEFSAPVDPDDPAIAYWTVPSVSPPSNHCAPNGIAGDCDLSLWVGQTNVSGGYTQIAQTGQENFILCANELFYWDCSTIQDDWYEFQPSQPTVRCSTVSAGDELQGWSQYLADGEYEESIYDFQSGAGCTSYYSLSMGRPYYAEFMSENPAYSTGGYLATPQFSKVQFNTIEAEGKTSVCSLLSFPYSQAADVTAGPCLFNGDLGTYYNLTYS